MGGTSGHPGRERNPECARLLRLLWHVGGSQTDVANLHAEDVDWKMRVISYSRKKTGTISHLRFGDEVETILRSLPTSGSCFRNWLLSMRSTGPRNSSAAARFGNQWNHAAFLPLCVGRARTNGGLPRTVRTAGIGTQQQGRASCLRQEGASHCPRLGRLREETGSRRKRHRADDGGCLNWSVMKFRKNRPSASENPSHIRLPLSPLFN